MEQLVAQFTMDECDAGSIPAKYEECLATQSKQGEPRLPELITVNIQLTDCDDIRFLYKRIPIDQAPDTISFNIKLWNVQDEK